MLYAFMPVMLSFAAAFLVVALADLQQKWPRTLIVYGGYLLWGRYMYWRCTESIPDVNIGWEAVVVYGFLVLELVTTWWGLEFSKVALYPPKDRSSEADEHENWYGDKPPLVDVLIPSYKESFRVVEKTIVGAKGIDYPRYRIWLLDDGRRDWMRELAEKEEIGYLRRSDNANYKAGNLQNAIDHIKTLEEKPEFIAVFDADFVARPEFLRRAMALHYNPKVGIVQTPQTYYNPDPFQSRIGWKTVPHDQQWQYRFVHAERDAAWSAECYGTSYVARMEAIDAIEGIPTESTSEDTLMTIKMLKKGYRTTLLNEPVSVGLATENLHEFLVQRARWCTGNLEIAFSKWGPGADRSTLWKRLRGLVLSTRWAQSLIVTWTWVLWPGVFWYTGFILLNATTDEVASYVLPMWGLRIARGFLVRGARPMAIWDAVMLITSLAVMPATWAYLTKGTVKRRPSDKGLLSSNVSVEWKPLIWLLVPTLLLASGIVLNFFEDARYGALAYYYSFMSLLGLVLACSICFSRPQRRLEQRYPTSETAILETAHGVTQEVHVTELGISGALVDAQVQLSVGSSLSLALSNDDKLTGRVARVTGTGFTAIAFDDEREQRQRMIRRLLCGYDYVREEPAYSEIKVMWALIRTALGFKNP